MIFLSRTDRNSSREAAKNSAPSTWSSVWSYLIWLDLMRWPTLWQQGPPSATLLDSVSICATRVWSLSSRSRLQGLTGSAVISSSLGLSACCLFQVELRFRCTHWFWCWYCHCFYRHSSSLLMRMQPRPFRCYSCWTRNWRRGGSSSMERTSTGMTLMPTML